MVNLIIRRLFYTLKQGKLTINANKRFTQITNNYPPITEKYLTFELDKTAPEDRTTEQQEAFDSISNEIRGVLSNMRTEIEEITEYIYIPDLAPVA